MSLRKVIEELKSGGESKWYPIRFRTEEDAKKALRCLYHINEIPENIALVPFEFRDGKNQVNPEYVHAPFELCYKPLDPCELVDADSVPVNRLVNP